MSYPCMQGVARIKQVIITITLPSFTSDEDFPHRVACKYQSSDWLARCVKQVMAELLASTFVPLTDNEYSIVFILSRVVARFKSRKVGFQMTVHLKALEKSIEKCYK